MAIKILTMIIRTMTLKNDYKSVNLNDNNYASNNFEKNDKNMNDKNNKEESSNLFSVDLNIFEN